VYTGDMPQIATTSPAGRLPLTDGRSAEARFVKRIRGELIAQCGDASGAQRLLIDRAVMLSLRILQIDQHPTLADSNEYIELTKLLAALLGQLSGQPAPASTVHRPLIRGAAA
jgi:hypothetical protein